MFISLTLNKLDWLNGKHVIQVQKEPEHNLNQLDKENSSNPIPQKQDYKNRSTIQVSTYKHRRYIKRRVWKKIQDKRKAIQIESSAVYNYSKIKLTEPMAKILNRGLNFCVTPSTLNLTQIKSDFDKFERRVLWKEWWHGRKDVEIEVKKDKKFISNRKHTSTSKRNECS